MPFLCPIDGFEVDINLAENPISLRSQEITKEYICTYFQVKCVCVCVCVRYLDCSNDVSR